MVRMRFEDGYYQPKVDSMRASSYRNFCLSRFGYRVGSGALGL